MIKNVVFILLILSAVFGCKLFQKLEPDTLYIYLALDDGRGKIQRYDMNSFTTEDIVSTGIVSPYGIAVDEVNKKSTGRTMIRT